MKAKMKNVTVIEGYLYDYGKTDGPNKLEKRVTGENSKNPGTEYIKGEIMIATDEDCLNIVPVHYSYVAPTFPKSGKVNPNFAFLSNVIDGKVNTVTNSSKEQAAKINISSAIGVNDFYTDRNGEVELVSAKRNEGGFVNIRTSLTPDEKQRATFDVDMVITNTSLMEADEEKGYEEKLKVKGCIFDFANNLLPVEFVAKHPAAINYFQGLEVSPKTPVFTEIKGIQINETVYKEIEQPSAFGDPIIRSVPRSNKEWVITWAAQEPYLWDDESTLTVKELTDMMAKREVKLAEDRQRFDNSRAGNAIPASSNETVFKF